MTENTQLIQRLEAYIVEVEEDYNRFAVRYGVDTIGAHYKLGHVIRLREALREAREGVQS